MFSFFRRGVTGKAMLIFLGIAVFSLVATGFGTGGSGIGGLGGGDALATVGGEEVSSARVRQQVDRQLSRARQQQPEIDLASFLRGGALEGIVGEMITETALRVFGRDQGMGASKKMIDREIASIPAFQNLAGQFDQTSFERALASENLNEAQLRDEIESSLIQRQILLPVAGSAQTPRGVAVQYASLLLESRSGSVGFVPARAMGPGNEPSDAEVAAFYRDSQARFTIPERRVLRYALFGPEQVAAAATPTEAEIAAFYNRNTATYGPKETRTLSQVVLPDEAAARAFAAKIAAGTSFAKAAADAGFAASDTAIGQQTKEAFARSSTPAIANAAFAAQQGATTAPVRSELGWHVVRVDAINRTPARTLASVRGEIATQLAQQKLQTALAALDERIQQRLDDGSSFDEIAKAEKLAVRETPPITGTGVNPANPKAPAPPEIAPLLATAFDMGENEDPVVEPVQPGLRFALLQVARIVPAAAPPLADIKERVKTELIAKRAADRARAVATSIVSKINSGVPAAQAFSEARVPLPPLERVTARRMDIARNNQVSPPLAMLFSLPRGKARLIPAPQGSGWLVVHLEKVVPGNAQAEPKLIDVTRTQFSQVLGDEYAKQFTNAVQAQLKVQRNAEAIAKMKRELPGGGAQ